MARAQADHLAGAALLLEAGADPNLQSLPTDDEYRSGQWGQKTAEGGLKPLKPGNDRSALHMAIDCEEPNPMILDLLLKSGADPNVRDIENRSALHLALDFEDNQRGVDLALAEVCRLRAGP